MDVKAQWEQVLDKLSQMFDADIDLAAVLYLVGVQEFGQGLDAYPKDEKMDMINYATEMLLSRFAIYLPDGQREDGLTRWRLNPDVPKPDFATETRMIQESAVLYFREQGLLEA